MDEHVILAGWRMRCIVSLACLAIASYGLAGIMPGDEAIPAGSTYCVDSRIGSDSNPGTREAPWKSLDAIHNRAFAPGDSICFAAGSFFQGGFIIASSGEPGRPITFTASGSGPKPIFTNPFYRNLNGNAIRINGSHIVIDGLFFMNCPMSPVCEDIRTLGAVYISPGADFNTVRNCEMTKTPVGIQVYGQHNCITHNDIHDNNVPVRPHWGPMGVVVCTSNNEICYNRFSNYWAPSNEYGHDGGAIEINDRDYPKENILIHHNTSYGNQGFIEFVGKVKQDSILIHHNVCEDYQSFIGFTGPCTRIRVEHNTVIRILAHETRDSEDVVFWFYYDNSDISFRNNIFVFDPEKVERVFARQKVIHDHNLFCRLGDISGSPDSGVFPQPEPFVNITLGAGESVREGEKTGDPLFVDFARRDLRLRPESPAVDAGADLGYTQDFDGAPIPSGRAPDIGAFERTENE